MKMVANGSISIRHGVDRVEYVIEILEIEFDRLIKCIDWWVYGFVTRILHERK